eukprot:97524-Rhodomonas_salina.1
MRGTENVCCYGFAVRCAVLRSGKLVLRLGKHSRLCCAMCGTEIAYGGTRRTSGFGLGHTLDAQTTGTAIAMLLRDKWNAAIKCAVMGYPTLLCHTKGGADKAHMDLAATPPARRHQGPGDLGSRVSDLGSRV